MKTQTLLLGLAAALLTVPTPSSQAVTQTTSAHEAQPSVLAEAEAKVDLKKFLYSTKGTYGWQPVKGTILYDFFKDGRVSVQGPDGEATMWEGKWSLKGDKLTISYDKKTTTVTAAIDGDKLTLDGQPYKRYKPE